MFVALAVAAFCLSPPVPGPVIAGYAPAGEYAGHWGVDYAADIGAQVQSPVSGTVTFAGSVAGMRAVTIEPVPGYKVSVSYLSRILVSTGQQLTRGSLLGTAGAPHGIPGVHLSVRLDGIYTDPSPLLGCADTDISRALRLVTPPRPYPRRRANRNLRRDLRPDPRSAPTRGRVRPASARSRSPAGDSGW